MYQQCTRCVMDNASDKNITFDNNGICNYCKQAEIALNKSYFPNDNSHFDKIVSQIKADCKNNKYDCLMGISGGLDSSYLLYLGIKSGLRILALHIDDGFNTPKAIQNVKNLVKKSGVDLVTISPNSKQFNDITKAYFRAGVCNIAAPQDNVVFANIYKHAISNKIKYFLTGANLSLESILERSETYPAFDVANIKDIHKRFGQLNDISEIEFVNYFQYQLIKHIYKLQIVPLLNYVNYNKYSAIKTLNEWCGYEYYEAKHLENELTKVVQLYWFYKKFGVDKRKSHLSSLIISGQLSRDEALNLLEKPVYDTIDMQNTIKIVCDKLGMSTDEFYSLAQQAPHSHYDYKIDFFYNLGRKIKHMLGK